jgi:hypothetical protein
VTATRGKKTINNDEVLAALRMADFESMVPVLEEQIERMSPGWIMALMVEFAVARKEKRRKGEEGEEGRKKRRVESGSGEISIDVSREEERHEEEDADTEVEEHDEEGEQEGDGAEEEEEEEEEEERGGRGEEIVIDMTQNEVLTEGEEYDEALAEDSD